jgi:hypothetical protein
MELGPEAINFGGDSAAERDRKACDGALYYAMKDAGQSDVQAHNGVRTYRSAVLVEAAEAVADPARRHGLGWESARDVLLTMAAEARRERTYGDPEAGTND